MAGHGLRLEDFAGLWTLERRIEDRRTGETGEMLGQAEFRSDGERLVYEETGSLRIGNRPVLRAGRRLRWQAAPDGAIEVLFEDGRAFHRIAADRPVPSDTHVCQPDIYHVEYDLRDWPRWQAVWRVVGPAKDYRLVTFYRRA